MKFKFAKPDKRRVDVVVVKNPSPSLLTETYWAVTFIDDEPISRPREVWGITQEQARKAGLAVAEKWMGTTASYSYDVR